MTSSLGNLTVWRNDGLDNATAANGNFFRDEFNNLYSTLGEAILIYTGTVNSLPATRHEIDTGDRDAPFYPIGTIVLIVNSTASETGQLYRRTQAQFSDWLHMGHIAGAGGANQAPQVPSGSIANQSIGVIKIDTTVLPTLRDTSATRTAHNTWFNTLVPKRGFIFIEAGVANYVEKSTDSGSTWTTLTTLADTFYAVQLDEGVRLRVPTTAGNSATALRVRGQVWSRQLSDTTDIKDLAVTTAKLADGSGTTVKHADNSVTGLKINENLFTKILRVTGTPTEVALDLGLIVDSGLHSGVIRVRSTLAGAIEFRTDGFASWETLTTNANTWYVKEFDEDNQLQVSTSASGTFTVTVEGFGSFIPDRGIKSRHIGTGEINTDNIAGDAVTAPKLPDGVIDISKLNDNMFGVAYNQTFTAENGNALQARLTQAIGTVNPSELNVYKITVGINNNGVAAGVLRKGATQISSYSGNTELTVTTTGAELININPSYADNTIFTSLRVKVLGGIRGGGVDGHRLANGAVDGSKIANSAVSTTKIANGAVDGSKIANSAVSTTKIANGAVTTAKIPNEAVDGTKLDDELFDMVYSNTFVNFTGSFIQGILDSTLGTDCTNGGEVNSVLKISLRASSQRNGALEKQTGVTGSWVGVVNGETSSEGYTTIVLTKNDKLRVRQGYLSNAVFTGLHIKSFGRIVSNRQIVDGTIEGIKMSDDLFEIIFDETLVGANNYQTQAELQATFNRILGTYGTNNGEEAGVYKINLQGSNLGIHNRIELSTDNGVNWTGVIRGYPAGNTTFQTLVLRRTDRIRVITIGGALEFTKLTIRKLGGGLVGDQVKSRNIADDAVQNEHIASHDVGSMALSSVLYNSSIQQNSNIISNLTVLSTANTLGYTRIGNLVHVQGLIRLANSRSGSYSGNVFFHNALPYDLGSFDETGDFILGTWIQASIVQPLFASSGKTFHLGIPASAAWPVSSGIPLYISLTYISA